MCYIEADKNEAKNLVEYTPMKERKFTETRGKLTGTPSMRKAVWEISPTGEHVGVVREFETPVCLYDLEDVRHFLDMQAKGEFAELGEEYRNLVVAVLGRNYLPLELVSEFMRAFEEAKTYEHIGSGVLAMNVPDIDVKYGWLDLIHCKAHPVKRNLSSAVRTITELFQTRVGYKLNEKTRMFDYVLSAIGDTVYKISREGVYIVSAPYSNERPRKVSVAKNYGNHYYQIAFRESKVYMHHVMPILLADDFGKGFDEFMKSTDICVNHMVNEVPEYETYGVKRTYVPKRGYAYEPEYLEFVTQGQNKDIGQFCKDYGIHDVPVSVTIGDYNHLKDLVKRLHAYDPTADCSRLVLRYYHSIGCFLNYKI